MSIQTHGKPVVAREDRPREITSHISQRTDTFTTTLYIVTVIKLKNPVQVVSCLNRDTAIVLQVDFGNLRLTQIFNGANHVPRKVLKE